MNTRLLIVATMLGSLASAADEPTSRLRYPTPEKWERSVDAGSHLVSLTPPGGKASVTFAPSTEFAGTAEEWQREMWSGILEGMKLTGPPQSGEQGKFLTRMGVFSKPDGSRPWVCLYTLVQDGRGEGVIFFAAEEAQFFEHLFTVNKMIHRITVAPPLGGARPAVAGSAVPAAPAAPRGPTIAGGDELAGLYLATTSQFRFNPLGGPGSGSWVVATEFYLLARDGRVFRGPDLPKAPDGDISRFDYEAARREAPAASGTYTVRGDQVVLRLGDASGETITANRIETDTLEIRGTNFRRGIRERPAPGSASPSPATPAAPAVAADNFVPVLGYDEPAGFYRGAGTSPIEYASREVNAGIQVYAFRPYTGDIATTFRQTLLRDWIDPRWRESSLAAPPEIVQYRIPGATAALVAGFHENTAGLLNERMRMVIAAGDMAALVDISANSTSSWQKVSPPLRAMLDSLRVERKPAPPSLAAGPGPAGAALAGLYLGTKSKYMVNLQRGVGYGDTKLALHYYLFSADGRVYCCYDFPPGGAKGAWKHFDFDGAQRDDPGNTGRYTVRGSQLLIQMSAQGSETITSTIRDSYRLEIQTINYVRDR